MTEIELSNDAKTVLGAWFGMGSKSVLNLHLRQSKPTARCQAALDELVEAKILSRKPFNQFGGVTYAPLIETRTYLTWLIKRGKKLGDFALMEPVTEGGK
jgi:hypothetical protein